MVKITRVDTKRFFVQNDKTKILFAIYKLNKNNLKDAETFDDFETHAFSWHDKFYIFRQVDKIASLKTCGNNNFILVDNSRIDFDDNLNIKCSETCRESPSTRASLFQTCFNYSTKIVNSFRKDKVKSKKRLISTWFGQKKRRVY